MTKMMNEELPLVHTMVRFLNKEGRTAPGKGQSTNDVDADVGSWVAKGYRLVNALPGGNDVAAYCIIYVLARDPQ